MNLTGLYVYRRIIFYWHIFHSNGFHHICNIKCRLDCRYSPQNIFNAKNFNPHKKPISLLNVPICTQGMQRTWWPEAGTIIVTGPYSNWILFVGQIFPHHCRVSEAKSFNSSIPIDDVTGDLAQCIQYDNSSVSNVTVGCTEGWVHSAPPGETTIVMEVRI